MKRLNRRIWRVGMFIGLCLWEFPLLVQAPSAAAASYRWILPSSAHCAGRGNSFWTTDLILGNLGDSEASVLLKFHSGLGDENTLEKQLVLPPHSSQHYQDVLASVFGLESGFGALHAVASQAEITVTSQTSTAAAQGRYGQSVPAFSSNDWIVAGSPRQLCALREDENFRTNLVLANATAQALEVEARLFSADGRLLGKSLYLLSGWEMLQRNRVLAEIAPQETALTHTRLELTTTTPQGAFAAYASVIDNVTQDPRTVLPQWGSALLLPSVAHIQGQGNSFWTTNLTVANPTAVLVNATLKFLPANQEGGIAAERNLHLEPGQSLYFADVLGSLFGVESGYGALRLCASDPGLLMQAETETHDGQASYGQSVPGFNSEDLVRFGTPSVMEGICESEDCRTNLVLANILSRPLAVNIALHGEAGEVLAEKRYSLPAQGMLQINRIVNALGVTQPLEHARLQLVTPTGGGLLAAYASRIDNQTQDPRTLLAAVPAPPPNRSLRALGGGAIFVGSSLELVPDGVVLIESDRIRFAGRRSEVSLPFSTQYLDVKGGTILPGLINAHVHNAFNNDDLLRTWAREGVTTVRDVGSYYTSADAFKSRDRSNRIPACARVIACGRILTVPNGYPLTNPFPAQPVLSPEDARQQTLLTIDEGADAIKIALEPGWTWPILTREEVAAITKAAHERGKRVTAHVSRIACLQLAMEMGVDDSAHLPEGSLSPKLAKAMAARRMGMVPTLHAMAVYGRGGDWSANLSLLKAEGVRIAMGNDGGFMAVLEVGLPLTELEMMQAAGMSSAEVLVASTSAAAYICQREEVLGSLEAGKWADVLVVEGNPTLDLKALAHPLLVMREGAIIRSSLGL